MRSFWSLLLSRLNSSISLSLPSQERCPSPLIIYMGSSAPALTSPHLSCAEDSRAGHYFRCNLTRGNDRWDLCCWKVDAFLAPVLMWRWKIHSLEVIKISLIKRQRGIALKRKEVKFKDFKEKGRRVDFWGREIVLWGGVWAHCAHQLRHCIDICTRQREEISQPLKVEDHGV